MKHGGGSIMLWGVFQLQGQDDWLQSRKDECGQVQGYPGRKPSPECSGPQTGPKVYLPTRQ